MRSLEAEPRWRLLGRVIALWVALFIAKSLVPHTWLRGRRRFRGPQRQLVGIRARDSGAARAQCRSRHRDSAAAGLQPALLQAAFARLARQRKGSTDIYAIGIAGWSEQDVFVKEVDGAFAALERSLPIKDRTLRLVNNPATVETVPLASRRNFAAAARGRRAMDKNEDVLLLFMTSHGNAGGIALQLPGGRSTVLAGAEVRTTLDGEGIRNRVVIVSACYGGVFVEPLANDDTIVLTAADARSTSFGCAAGRDWTYFGDALFKQSLHSRERISGARSITRASSFAAGK